MASSAPHRTLHTASSRFTTSLFESLTSDKISTSVPNPTSAGNSTSADEIYHQALLGIYSVVLVSGLICLGLTIHIIKSSATSITSIAVLNLIFTHLFFLLTVPFRIYYYSNNQWELGTKLCKVVSSMIHIHMYMSFIFYTIILTTRLWSFYRKTDHIASFQRLHALLISAGVWTVVLVVCPCVVAFYYGNKGDDDKKVCFKFANNIESVAKVLNYIISFVIIVVTAVLMALQANVLLVLYKRDGQMCTSQQDFSAQLKSLCFALIMVISFIPYQIFRLHYLGHLDTLQNANEVFLSLTTFNCLDMLTFLGRRSCFVCYRGKAV